VVYVLVLGGAVAAGAVPVLAFVAYKATKSAHRQKEARRRRLKKIEL
jgi:hypothetical protein